MRSYHAAQKDRKSYVPVLDAYISIDLFNVSIFLLTGLFLEPTTCHVIMLTKHFNHFTSEILQVPNVLQAARGYDASLMHYGFLSLINFTITILLL